MWAVESGRSLPEVNEDIIYYKMAKDFHLPPEVVDRMDSERVDSLIFIDTAVREKEDRLAKAQK